MEYKKGDRFLVEFEIVATCTEYNLVPDDTCMVRFVHAQELAHGVMHIRALETAKKIEPTKEVK